MCKSKTVAFSHSLELRSKPSCLYFSGSGLGEDILIPPILRHRKAPLFVQALVSLESLFLSLYKCWWTNVLLCVQESAEAAPQQAEREDVTDR